MEDVQRPKAIEEAVEDAEKEIQEAAEAVEAVKEAVEAEAEVAAHLEAGTAPLPEEESGIDSWAKGRNKK